MTLPDWKPSVEIEVKYDEILIRKPEQEQGNNSDRTNWTISQYQIFHISAFFFLVIHIGT